jgi:eukaryotic-like serine/threonine-protein kinase
VSRPHSGIDASFDDGATQVAPPYVGEDEPTVFRADPRGDVTRIEVEADPLPTIFPTGEPLDVGTLTPRPRFGAGAVLDRYRLEKLIGEGTFGRVFVGHDIRLDRQVAIKVLHPDQALVPEIRQRFVQEAYATARIHHPGVVTVFDVGESPEHDTAYIVMELLRGRSLQTHLKQHGSLVALIAQELGRQLASALDAAHRCGVIHRDLKPENIILVSDAAAPGGERTKLFDFGLAKAHRPVNVHTSVNTVFGTPAYMSPEQCLSTASVDQRSDIYALGCILFALLVGRPPFNGAPHDIMTCHRIRPAPDVATLVPNLPAELAALIARMLAKSPDARPASMAEVEEALAACQIVAPRHHHDDDEKVPRRGGLFERLAAWIVR